MHIYELARVMTFPVAQPPAHTKEEPLMFPRKPHTRPDIPSNAGAFSTSRSQASRSLFFASVSRDMVSAFAKYQ